MEIVRPNPETLISSLSVVRYWKCAEARFIGMFKFEFIHSIHRAALTTRIQMGANAPIPASCHTHDSSPQACPHARPGAAGDRCLGFSQKGREDPNKAPTFWP